MDRTALLNLLREYDATLRATGVTGVDIFGSRARGTERADSDLDLFIDYDPERFSFVELIQLRKRLSDILGRSADLTTREGLHPLLRPTIEAEAIKML